MIAYPSGCPGGPGECPDWGVEHSAWRARTVSTPVGQCTCQHSHTVTAIASPLWVLPDSPVLVRKSVVRLQPVGVCVCLPWLRYQTATMKWLWTPCHASLGQKPTMAWLSPLPALKWRCRVVIWGSESSSKFFPVLGKKAEPCGCDSGGPAVSWGPFSAARGHSSLPQGAAFTPAGPPIPSHTCHSSHLAFCLPFLPPVGESALFVRAQGTRSGPSDSSPCSRVQGPGCGIRGLLLGTLSAGVREVRLEQPATT